MPHFAYHATLDNRLTLHERSLLMVMVGMVNELRAQAGLPPLSRDDVAQQLVKALRDEMRTP